MNADKNHLTGLAQKENCPALNRLEREAGQAMNASLTEYSQNTKPNRKDDYSENLVPSLGSLQNQLLESFSVLGLEVNMSYFEMLCHKISTKL